MANTLRFKRGLVSGIPTAALGEPLFTTDTFDLYIGNGTGNTRFQKYIASGTTSQLLRGDGSLYTFPLAISSPSAGQVLKYNGTSWVNDSDAGITGSGAAGQVAYFTGATTQSGSNNLFWDASNSRLGIGTNAPRTNIHTLINGNASGGLAGTTIIGQNSSSGSNSYITLIGAFNAEAGLIFTDESTAYKGRLLYNNLTEYFAFWTDGAERMRLHSTGNLHLGGTSDNGLRFQVTGDGYFSGSVGIGVVPTTNLHISGGNTALASSGNILLQTTTNGADVGMQITFGNNTASRRASISGRQEGASGAAGYLQFSTRGTSGDVTERMRLDASGNLGLGVVPSAWASGYTALQVGNSLAFLGKQFAADIYANSYYDGTNFKYIGANFATLYALSSGQHRWFNAPSGSAGANISFTQAMTLFATGNLAVGTTTDAGFRLDVNGTMRVSGAVTIGLRNALQASVFGYSTGYKTLIVGSSGTSYTTDATTLAFNVDVSGNPSGSFTGNGTEYIWRNAGRFITPNSINNGFNQLFIWNSSGELTFTGAATFSSSVTAATFIPSYNTVNYITDGAISNYSAINYLYVNGNAGGGLFLKGEGTGKNNIRIESSTLNLITFQTNSSERMRITSDGNVGIGMTPSYKLDVTGEARISNAIAIGTTPDTNKPFKILKNINGTVGINFENTSTGSSAFSAIQMGTDVSGGTKFTNIVYSSSGVAQSGVYYPDGTSIINIGTGGLNFYSQGAPIRMFNGGGNGVLKWEMVNDSFINHYTGTAPTTSATDGYRQYSADVVAGNAAPHFRTENGAVIKLYQETTGVGNAIFSQGGGNSVLDDSTFDGYTLRQIVKALRNQGILA